MKDKTIVEFQSHLEIVGFIKAQGTQCRFIGMTSRTIPKNIKAASPYKGVIKTSIKYGMINVDYAEAVKRRIVEKLGLDPAKTTYEAQESWHEHLFTTDGKPLPLVKNKNKDDGELYLMYYPRGSKNAYNMPDGTPVKEEDIKPWFYERKDSGFKPPVIMPKLSNILRLAASGVILQSEDIEEAEALVKAAI